MSGDSREGVRKQVMDGKVSRSVKGRVKKWVVDVSVVGEVKLSELLT